MTASLYLDEQHTAPVWHGPEHPVWEGPQHPVWQGPERPVRRRPERRVTGEIPFERDEWAPQAACRQGDPDALFVKGVDQRSAAEICRSCRVRNHCLVTALDNREEFGVWGGLTERQRRALLRKNAHIEKWADHLTTRGDLVGIEGVDI